MKIELRKLSNVKPYPGNPRQNDAAVDAVAASIKEFGFRQPIVVDTDGVIICRPHPLQGRAELRAPMERFVRHLPRDFIGTSRPVGEQVPGPAARSFYTYNAVKRK